MCSDWLGEPSTVLPASDCCWCKASVVVPQMTTSALETFLMKFLFKYYNMSSKIFIQI